MSPIPQPGICFHLTSSSPWAVMCHMLRNCHPEKFQGERADAGLLVVELGEKLFCSTCSLTLLHFPMRSGVSVPSCISSVARPSTLCRAAVTLWTANTQFFGNPAQSRSPAFCPLLCPHVLRLFHDMQKHLGLDGCMCFVQGLLKAFLLLS